MYTLSVFSKLIPSKNIVNRLPELFCLSSFDTKLPVDIWIGNFKEDEESDFYLHISTKENHTAFSDSDVAKLDLYEFNQDFLFKRDLALKTKLKPNTIKDVTTYIIKNYAIIYNYYLHGNRTETLLALRGEIV